MTVYQIDPLRDERWNTLVEEHPNASIFHTRGWLLALRRTYGYQPVAFTSSCPEAPLSNALAFCYISGWLNVARLVSLPFSDHGVPLVEDSDQLEHLLGSLRRWLVQNKWDYIEIRGVASSEFRAATFPPSRTFLLHRLDLRPGLDEIFNKFHKSCVQRKILRAYREHLKYEEGQSDYLVGKFHHLLVLTRRRHGLTVQPIGWFRNLMACLGDKATIRVASKDGRPIASILTLRHRDVLVYKYGCSDRRFSTLGGTQFLFWKAIQDAKRAGLSELDMGRSERDHAGLLSFKDRWGANRSELTYFRYPERTLSHNPTQARIVKYVWSHTPGGILSLAGRVLYKYMG